MEVCIIIKICFLAYAIVITPYDKKKIIIMKIHCLSRACCACHYDSITEKLHHLVHILRLME